MANPADFDDEAWLFGESFDLDAVLARGRTPDAGWGSGQVRGWNPIRAARRAAAWLAALAMLQCVLGVLVTTVASERSGGLVVAAAGLAGIFAVWLALTPVPTAMAATTAVTAVMALAETTWAVLTLFGSAPGEWSRRGLAVTCGLVAWLMVAAAAGRFHRRASRRSG
jgi:hypothetical protein